MPSKTTLFQKLTVWSERERHVRVHQVVNKQKTRKQKLNYFVVIIACGEKPPFSGYSVIIASLTNVPICV